MVAVVSCAALVSWAQCQEFNPSKQYNNGGGSMDITSVAGFSYDVAAWSLSIIARLRVHRQSSRNQGAPAGCLCREAC
jgi:hypothetical protein